MIHQHGPADEYFATHFFIWSTAEVRVAEEESMVDAVRAEIGGADHFGEMRLRAEEIILSLEGDSWTVAG